MKAFRWRWPFVVLVLSSFALGAFWGWQVIQDRAAREGRLESVSELKILAPQGVFTQKILLEFQKKERIRVILHEDPFPGSLIRRALKSAPGEYDAVLVFHYQLSALRNERRMQSLFDANFKFPTSISPDFRKLPDDRNLMETAPLQWGLLGQAKAANHESSNRFRFTIWPGFLIGAEAPELPAQNFVSKYIQSISPMNNGESMLRNLKDPSLIEAASTETLFVSHASLAFPPYKDLKLEFSGVPLANRPNDRGYFLWILTLTAMADGDLEATRKFMRFLIDPARNLALVQATKIGGTTLRDQTELGDIPEVLRSSYFRKFPLQSIVVERDERLRQTDDLVEQAILGAAIVAQATPPPKKPEITNPATSSTPPTSTSDEPSALSTARPALTTAPAKPKVKASPAPIAPPAPIASPVSATPTKAVEPKETGNKETENSEERVKTDSTDGSNPDSSTEPSEEPSPGD